MVRIVVVADDHQHLVSLGTASFTQGDTGKAARIVGCGERTVRIGERHPVRLEGVAKDDPTATPRRVGIDAKRLWVGLIERLEVLCVLGIGIDQNIVIEHTGRLEVGSGGGEAELKELTLEERVGQVQ